VVCAIRAINTAASARASGVIGLLLQTRHIKIITQSRTRKNSFAIKKRMHAKKTVAGLGLRAVLGGYLEQCEGLGRGWVVRCVINLLFGVALVVVPVVVCNCREETFVRNSCR
jgi:hypothetical protein